jgi:hypothetical protein
LCDLVDLKTGIRGAEGNEDLFGKKLQEFVTVTEHEETFC